MVWAVWKCDGWEGECGTTLPLHPLATRPSALPAPQTQAKGFGLFSLMWGLGSLSGPSIGGALAQPCSGALRVEALCRPGSLLVARCGGAGGW